MHDTSYAYMENFISKYLDPNKKLDIADIGSFDENGTYRPLFENDRTKHQNWKYIGVDLVPGPNVDIIVPHPFKYDNIEDNSQDVVISGQALEHVVRPFLWMTELYRILKTEGLICIICPWYEALHNGPHYKDYWRVLPNGMKTLLTESGFEVLEVFRGRADSIESFTRKLDIGDTVGIGRKTRWLDG